jgi:hypothetical protein
MLLAIAEGSKRRNHPVAHFFEAFAFRPVIVVPQKFGCVGGLVYLEHNKILVGVYHLVLEAGTATEEDAFVLGGPIFENPDGARRCIGVTGELPLQTELVCCGAVTAELVEIVVDTGIIEVADTGIIPSASAIAPVGGVKTGYILYRTCLVSVAAKRASEKFLIGIAPWLLSEVCLHIVDVGGGMEHGRVIDGIYLGVVGGCGYFPILDIGGAVFDLAACACSEKCHTGHQYRKYFFHCSVK